MKKFLLVLLVCVLCVLPALASASMYTPELMTSDNATADRNGNFEVVLMIDHHISLRDIQICYESDVGEQLRINSVTTADGVYATFQQGIINLYAPNGMDGFYLCTISMNCGVKCSSKVEFWINSATGTNGSDVYIMPADYFWLTRR